MALIPSPYQKAVFYAVRDTNNSLLINAVAGSGKTTTIVRSVRLLPKYLLIIFVAFNKSIAEELSNRLPDHVDASTLHSLGFKAWQSIMKFSCKVDQKKVYNIIDNDPIIEDIAGRHMGMLRFALKKMVGFAKNTGIVPKSVPTATGLVEDTDEMWIELIQHYGVEFNLDRKRMTFEEYSETLEILIDKSIAICRRVLEVNLKNRNVVDFDDMLYLPVVYDAPFRKHDVVLADEAQDISGIQRVMLHRALKKSGRLIAVGDRFQAIYGFRGADSESLDKIKEEFECQELPLSICYRCPKSVIQEAKKIVPAIEAHSEAIEGTVSTLGAYDDSMSAFQEYDYVLCRNVAPLVRCAFALIRVNKPCAIAGKDIGTQIISLIRKLNPKNLIDLEEKVKKWKDKEVERIQKTNKDAFVGHIHDRADAVQAFTKNAKVSSIKEIIELVERMFTKDVEGAIILSTIHKAKGLEAKRVLFLDPQLIPSRYATNEWQKTQEMNLKYVAITRAQEFLGYIKTPTNKDM